MKNEQIESTDLTADEIAEACTAILDSEAVIVLAVVENEDGTKNLHSTIAGQKATLSSMIKQGIFDDKSLSDVVNHVMEMYLGDKISAWALKHAKRG